MPNSFSFLNKQIHVECVKWRGKDYLRNFSRIDRKTTRFWSEHFWSKIPDTCKNSISRFQRSIIRASLFTNIIIIGDDMESERLRKKRKRKKFDRSFIPREKKGWKDHRWQWLAGRESRSSICVSVEGSRTKVK